MARVTAGLETDFMRMAAYAILPVTMVLVAGQYFTRTVLMIFRSVVTDFTDILRFVCIGRTVVIA